MFNIIGIILSGVLVGIAARFFYPGAVEMGLLKTTALGVAGALLVGTITAMRTGAGLREGFNRAGCFGSVLGAMLLIFLARTFGWGM